MVWAVPCDCTKSEQPDRALTRARIPERYRHCDFENFETDNDIENVAREQLQVLESQPGAGEARGAAFCAGISVSLRQ